MASNSESTPNKVYHGNCHCGNFKYKLTIPEVTSLLSCDCSICSRRGYLFIFPPAEAVEIVIDGPLQSYTFANRKLAHKFCATCGNGVYAEFTGSSMKGFNARLIDPRDLDASKLERKSYKGSDIEPRYTPHEYKDHNLEKSLAEGEKVYTGSCHCGAVKVAVKTKPLQESKVIACNCSICYRNGDANVYPEEGSFALSGEDNLTSYIYPKVPYLDHKFCKTCGIAVGANMVVPPNAEDLVREKILTHEKMEDIKKSASAGGMAVTVRVLEDVDWDSLKIFEYDGRSNPPLYECP